MSLDRIKHLFEAFWLTATGLTIGQLNSYLGALSLIIGISYQVWKWKSEHGKESKSK